jgi:hypothetical protein
MLIARIDEPEAAPCHELWEVEFLLGQSTGPLQKEKRRA